MNKIKYQKYISQKVHHGKYCKQCIAIEIKRIFAPLKSHEFETVYQSSSCVVLGPEPAMVIAVLMFMVSQAKAANACTSKQKLANL